jgi:hypothetical protein
MQSELTNARTIRARGRDKQTTPSANRSANTPRLCRKLIILPPVR